MRVVFLSFVILYLMAGATFGRPSFAPAKVLVSFDH